jgi:F0F1-type ATP synthase membrane subunit c/vacuolar-type H+-ATPase subunit K
MPVLPPAPDQALMLNVLPVASAFMSAWICWLALFCAAAAALAAAGAADAAAVAVACAFHAAAAAPEAAPPTRIPIVILLGGNADKVPGT